VRKRALRTAGDDAGSHPCCRAWVAEQAHGRGWRSGGADDARRPRAAIMIPAPAPYGPAGDAPAS